MKGKIFALLVFVLLMHHARGDTQESQSSTASNNFKTVHFFNLDSEAQKDVLVAILAEFNRLFVELGHSETQYRLWHIENEKSGSQCYMWESTWSNKDVYQEIHDNDDYKNLVRKNYAMFARLLKDHKYMRYRVVPIISGNKKE